MQIDKNVQIQQENRILLRKMLVIDLTPSELSKQKMKPLSLQHRSSSAGKARTSLNVHNRLEELRKISDENRIILRKIQDSKSHYNSKEWEKENKEREHQCEMMSKCAGRYTKHPFFINQGKPFNPAATFYRSLMNQSASPQKRQIDGYKLFSQTMYNEKLQEKSQSATFLKPFVKKRKIKKIKLKNLSRQFQHNSLDQPFHSMELSDITAQPPFIQPYQSNNHSNLNLIVNRSTIEPLHNSSSQLNNL